MSDTRFKLASDVISEIPYGWEAAEIFVANGIGGLQPIVRVSLQKNGTGRMVVLIYTEDFNK